MTSTCAGGPPGQGVPGAAAFFLAGKPIGGGVPGPDRSAESGPIAPSGWHVHAPIRPEFGRAEVRFRPGPNQPAEPCSPGRSAISTSTHIRSARAAGVASLGSAGLGGLRLFDVPAEPRITFGVGVSPSWGGPVPVPGRRFDRWYRPAPPRTRGREDGAEDRPPAGRGHVDTCGLPGQAGGPRCGPVGRLSGLPRPPAALEN